MNTVHVSCIGACSTVWCTALNSYIIKDKALVLYVA